MSAAARTLLSVRHFTSRLPPRASLLLFLVPLLNVLFLLLIFVMIGTSVMPLPGLTIELPTVTEPVYTNADKYVLSMGPRDEQGRRTDGPSAIYFDNTRVANLNQLENALPRFDPRETGPKRGTSKSAADHQPVVILRADREVPLRELVPVMELCRRKGLRLLLVTEPAKP